MLNSTDSIWIGEKQSYKKYPRLDSDLTVDVAIIGGGITGVTTAYLLAKAGKKVALFEKRRIGSGMTGLTTAFITYSVDAYLQNFKKTFGDEKATKVWESNKAAIDLIAQIIKEEKIECEFKHCPVYIYSLDDKGAQMLQKEQSVAHELGFYNLHFLQTTYLPFKNKGYLMFEKQAKFQPLRYLHALAEKAAGLGAMIFEETEIERVHGSNPTVLRSGNHNISAAYAVIATYTPFNNPLEIQTKLLPYQTYVIEGKIQPGIFEEAIYWDTEDPYNYFRIEKGDGFDRIILGGRDHKTGQQDSKRDYYKELEKYFHTKLLPDSNIEVKRRWSGEIIDTIDGIPYIGHLPSNENQLVATGFAGNGMTYSHVAAMICTDIILGRINPWIDLYDPKRFAGIGEFIKQNVDYPVQLVKGLLHKPKPESDLDRDSGEVVEVNGKKRAVYKDRQGNVITLSAICTHLGCTVGWNHAEKTWDCPCHGSRFTKEGAVLVGPAQKPLQREE